jgi:hypothetical protein
MNVATIINSRSWLQTTVTRSTSIVPTYGFGMGDVCPMELNHVVLNSTDKRRASAAQATVWGPQPWSPPVT